MKIHLSISLFFLALVTSFLFISTLGNFSPAIEDSDSIVVRKWMNITVDVRKRRILSMGSGKLYKTRLVGMLGPSGR